MTYKVGPSYTPDVDSKQKIADTVEGAYARLFENLTRIAPMLLRSAALVAAGVLLGMSAASSARQSDNPFAGECFYVVPDSDAGKQADEWCGPRPEDAEQMDKIAEEPTAFWLGDDSARGADIALGAYIPGAPSDPAKIDEFARTVGATPSVIMWYQDWAHSGVKEFDPRKMDTVASKGAMPMVTWEPWDWSGGGSSSQAGGGGALQPEYAPKTIVAGDHDDYIRQWAKDAAAWGKPMYLRFAHEMNGDW